MEKLADSGQSIRLHQHHLNRYLAKYKLGGGESNEKEGERRGGEGKGEGRKVVWGLTLQCLPVPPSTF